LKTGVERKKNSSMDGGGPYPHDRKTKSVPRIVPFYHSLQTGTACAELGIGQRRTNWNYGTGMYNVCDGWICVLIYYVPFWNLALALKSIQRKSELVPSL
jgi:hypothetical protein